MFGIPAGVSVLFSPETRRRLALCVLGGVVAAGLEIIGVVSVVPLMQLLTGSPTDTGALGRISDVLGDPAPERLAVIIALVVFGAFVLKALFTLVFRWWMTGFLTSQEAETSTALLRRYLAAPYWVHLHRHSQAFARTMTQSVDQTYSLVVGGSITVMTESVAVVALAVVLLVTNPVPALIAIVYFAVAGIAFERIVRVPATRAGEVFQKASLDMHVTVLQTLQGIKEVKVRRTSAFFLDRYDRSRRHYARARRVYTFLGDLPRYALELVFVGGVAVLTAITLTQGNSAATLTTLALFLAAGFRMLPSLVRIVASLQQIRTGVPAVQLVLDDVRSTDLFDAPADDPRHTRRTPLRSRLDVDDVTYRYPGSTDTVLDGVTLSVTAGTSTALVGSSGAGKTTLVDIVLGLHQPEHGRVLVDGAPVDDDLPAWQRSIGLVPQDVYVIDDTLRANIALGEPADMIDEVRLAEAVRMAQLDDHVATLPEGLDTKVGERGARMSGGQRQRLGMARALYRHPDVLVLDEATSSLDNETERRISEVINTLHGRMTVLVVAHRLSTVRSCDQIVFLERGKVAAVGTFEEVRRASPEFDHLVELGTLDGRAAHEEASSGADARPGA
ncbi:MAG TPA: ABC transporter ATP-binding protein [Ornithinibacter sp.]|nr:ABC transporter ATP-binding protein [Ornithinibacter sp.]